MKNKALFLYILFMFLITGTSPFLHEVVGDMWRYALFLAGIVAIVLQKKVHKGTFVDMGFRLNRNALIGLGAGLFLTVVVVFNFYVLPYLLGFAHFTLNEDSFVTLQSDPTLTTTFVILFIDFGFIFLGCLFGEELAFRGYILPKLEDRFGSVKAIMLCSTMFSLWHLPIFYSAYTGGVAESGWASLVMMLLLIGIQSVPVCILYLTTRELYGVSLYHGLLDTVLYSVLGYSPLGEGARYALYNMVPSNVFAVIVIGCGGEVLAIFLMLGLCRIAKKWMGSLEQV
jgi:membrane protease YdiL (CAAX protease family)